MKTSPETVPVPDFVDGTPSELAELGRYLTTWQNLYQQAQNGIITDRIDLLDVTVLEALTIDTPSVFVQRWLPVAALVTAFPRP